jgi:polyhydroxyalkanoate synthesis regulator phasin
MTKMMDELMSQKKASRKTYYRWLGRQVNIVHNELLKSMKQAHETHEAWIDTVVTNVRQKLDIHRMEIMKQALQKLWKTLKINRHTRLVVLIESYLATSWHVYA